MPTTAHTEQTQEREELSLLTDEGFSFIVTGRQRIVTRSLLFGLIKRYEWQEVKQTYTIKPPTLGTLLRIAKIGIQLPDITAPQEESEIFAHSWGTILEGTEKMALVIATAINSPTPIEETAEFIHQNLRPRELFAIIQRLYISCNLADFINSTRLVKSQRPTEPNRVESKGLTAYTVN